MKKKLVVLSGAGVSQESGLKTFRDMGGLWEQYEVTEVASIEAWNRNPELVLRFYNERRKKLWEAKPNAAHVEIAGLEELFEVDVVTQNVDDLHEQAGSSRVLHLHGELRKARSTADPNLVYTLQSPELNPGDLCEKGSQLRPHIVWFGSRYPISEKLHCWSPMPTFWLSSAHPWQFTRQQALWIIPGRGFRFSWWIPGNRLWVTAM